MSGGSVVRAAAEPCQRLAFPPNRFREQKSGRLLASKSIRVSPPNRRILAGVPRPLQFAREKPLSRRTVENGSRISTVTNSRGFLEARGNQEQSEASRIESAGAGRARSSSTEERKRGDCARTREEAPRSSSVSNKSIGTNGRRPSTADFSANRVER